MIYVKTRTNPETGKIEYYCYICQTWTEGKLWFNEYATIICDGCGLTFDDDYYGFFAIENGEGEQDGRN